ncbi:DUF624 domain-containing protein [Gryllotalpicola ginsengisoli]|uniref:DUF624 domain-containing protein n=1 Tax=Gryllotalpicola ginsengisoli TaxID=444608 RepID=UPI0003B32024|nr:DUF624 domain-containing protein [Gryllotalpicola ginsengisoli]
MTQARSRDFADGPLYRICLAVYGIAAPTACFLAACLPFIAAVFLIPWPPVLLVTGFSIGPAWVALLFAMHAFLRDRSFEPVRVFWRGWRLGWRQASALWVPTSILLALAGWDLTATDAATPVLRVVIGIVASVAALWLADSLLVVSRYEFRTRDVARLAAYLLVRRPLLTLANAALLLVAGGLVYLTGEWAAGLLAGLFALGAVANARSAFALVDAQFTDGAPAAQ